MEMGEEGAPHGVSTFKVAASVKPGRDWMPVPPMTAMWTGAVDGQTRLGRVRRRREARKYAPSYVEGTPAILR